MLNCLTQRRRPTGLPADITKPHKLPSTYSVVTYSQKVGVYYLQNKKQEKIKNSKKKGSPTEIYQWQKKTFPPPRPPCAPASSISTTRPCTLPRAATLFHLLLLTPKPIFNQILQLHQHQLLHCLHCLHSLPVPPSTPRLVPAPAEPRAYPDT